MSDPDQNDGEKKRLEALEHRLREVRKRDAPQVQPGRDFSQADLAWRMVIELVAGIGIGATIGYGLDVVFGTKPFLMIIFLFLGLIAGVRTMIRSANEVQMKQQAKAASEEKGEESGREH
ncbi:AtpZ/AtpI family protein [Ketogulonicigenium vulgare]|uniref:ATP synthase protein I n=1 Tax=Ketogulonicigenium vulgare (strain WSH-001) TaxID=759362 RepID=F9Y7H7_KETVW|nr:AtpZ/AtpI family protein [Ketogulonicigenium vulgare]ADO41283.1 ATP synthase F0, subunit I [Ketogulonicigenium vulgare Y25]AEM42273.1 ATP synthase F0, subunit I [Ketogulonicigenium vulgare WSH-001]ALJ79893.1 ATP synthase F0 subunit I [Ketogulonicigenium vulgare]ANW32795.1 F0F1 ATP synthase subunit I [Ketogulonicigenium vulgare]AOZ53109.1 ATP synthase F0, subunit I [Ketogulonicigenium vulgare]